MGNCVSLSIPCDSCMNKVSQCLDEKVGYIHNLEKNLTSLETTMKELKAERDDLSSKVTREEDRGQQRLAKIQVWLDNVETIEKRVKDLLSARNVELQRRCLCGFCSKGLISSYRYGKRVLLTLRDVEGLKRNGAFEDVAKPPQTSVVEERPLPRTIVGQETMLDKAWKHLTKAGVGTMGLYGMGGVGKTTLLTQLNNKFSVPKCGFDFVIWVVVSKELQVKKIQDEIAQKVGIDGVEWNQKDESQKALRLFNFLNKKRFVLFLDDIWQKVDLAKIGVPFPTPQNGCKVAFTTRSLQVCGHMEVIDPMEVQCLPVDEAFDLFQKKVGQEMSDPEIADLARTVARKCRGLPLALNVIGETMSCKKTVEEWRCAEDDLTSYAIEFPGMEDEILPILKYSYDNLKEEHLKSCLLYCALFPEDHRIEKAQLIDYWICEGLIDGTEGMERAENKGYDIIGSLVCASLLMEDGTDKVCMHDVVREMALWIASHLGQEKEAFIVHAGVGLTKMPKVKNWNVVRRMSLMENKFSHLGAGPECLQLTTLLMQKMHLNRYNSAEFFKSMPKLVVLDLSGNSFWELPDSISELVSLRYLNLSENGILVLPMSLLQGLKNLIHLKLFRATGLSSIAGISNLHNLKVLNLALSKSLRWDLRTVEELETLEHLEILSVCIGEQSVKPFFSSQRLMSCTRSLTIKDCRISETVDCDPESFVTLRDFSIEDCNISEIKMGGICNQSNTVSPLHNPSIPCFPSLSVVKISCCPLLKELTFLMFASNLKELHVRVAKDLEDVINKEKASKGEESGIVPFQKLVSLKLDWLPQLKNIHWRPLPFPCLKEILVERTKNLKKLPVDSKSGRHGENGLFITYDSPRWIKRVEWEDEATKTRFLSSCKEVEY